MNGNGKTYEFGAFRFVPSENLLLREGASVALPPKAIGVLAALVANNGHAVSKDDLIRDVWNGLAVEESTVSRNVWLVRQALGDDPRNVEFIQTVPKLGYRFVADVRNVEPVSSDPVNGNGHQTVDADLIPTAPDTTQKETDLQTSGPGRFRFPKVAVSAILLLGLTIGGYFYFAPRPATPEGTRSIAVLPFRPINTAARDEVLDIGFADALIHRLAPNKAFVVRPLGAIKRYAEIDHDPVAAGREQKVDYVLASIYQQVDGKVRVTAQLIDVSTGQIDVSHRFENSAADVFAMQDAVAAVIENKLLARFSADSIGSGFARGTNNEEAYRYYLLAQNFNELRGPENGRTALEQIDRAVALDPNFARAWATKAYIHRYMGYGPVAIEHSLRSIEAVEKALSLDPDLSEAHSVRCFNKFRYEYDFAGAESACKRALELDPNSPLAHKLHGNFLYTRGRFDEAISEIKKAIDLQPVSYDNQQTYALALYFARRYSEAEIQWKQLIPMNPNHPLIYGQLVRSLVRQGKEAEGFEHLIKLLTLEKESGETIQRFKAAFVRSGWRGVTLERIRLAESRGNARPYELARFYASINDKDKAFKLLDRAYQERSNMIAVIEVDPELDPLRNEPRYIEFLQRVERMPKL